VIQREGEGWRLAWDASRHPFSVLIGGAGWAAELTDLEAQALRDGVRDLAEQHRQLVNQLMAEESIELELERGFWWLCLEGDREGWSLRAVLSPEASQRAVEAFWPQSAAQGFTAALQQLYGQP
jgi:hypothetical protein